MKLPKPPAHVGYDEDGMIHAWSLTEGAWCGVPANYDGSVGDYLLRVVEPTNWPSWCPACFEILSEYS